MAPSTDMLWFSELFWHSQGGKVEHEAVLAALSSPKSRVGWPWVRSVRVVSKDDREMFACACVMERTPADFWLLVAKGWWMLTHILETKMKRASWGEQCCNIYWEERQIKGTTLFSPYSVRCCFVLENVTGSRLFSTEPQGEKSHPRDRLLWCLFSSIAPYLLFIMERWFLVCINVMSICSLLSRL